MLRAWVTCAPTPNTEVSLALFALQETEMPKNALTLSFHRTFAALAAAARAANAVDTCRAPRSDDLKALGIDPADYRRIGV